MAHVPHPSVVQYGPGVIEQLATVVCDAGVQRTLLVCGSTSFEASGAAGVLPSLQRVTQLTRWSDFSPNTDATDLARGLELMADTQPELVVGVGGGSTMDMAKLLCAFEGTATTDLADAVPATGPVDHRQLRLILSPTTSGSGSEATHFAVVYVGDDKYSIAGSALYPDTVLLDPDLGRTGSSYQRATSGIDAVCQSIESLWATGATDRSRRLARRALGLLLPAIEAFVHAPDDRSARAMCLGSHLAGRAIDISKTTAAHALSYGITKRYGISHGNAVALTLGHFIEAHAGTPDLSLRPEVDKATHHAAVHGVISALGAHDGREANRRFHELLNSIGLVSSLASAGMHTTADVTAIVDTVNVERLSNNPVDFGSSDLVKVLAAALETDGQGS